ncbi:MAG: hypothetical protein HY958_07175 [Bacteroidia bacterium]|nr:hypothetical protein [Bacteroidia bacterium]
MKTYTKYYRLIIISPLFILAVLNHVYAVKYETATTNTEIKQYDGPVDNGDINQKLLRIKLEVINGGATPPQVTSLSFNLTGNSQIQTLKLYTTDQDPVFNTSRLLATVGSPGTSVTFGTLAEADNATGFHYYWLVFDAVASVTLNTVVDAAYTGGTFITGPPAFAVTDPAGFRLTGRNYKIGTGEHYANIKTVADAFARFDYDGAEDIFMELTANYGTTAETAAITFTTHTGPAIITFRPANGQTGKITQYNPATGTDLITFNGVQKIKFDGRANGGDGSIQWTIRNTNISTVISTVFTFINDASNNTLTYLKIESDLAVDDNKGLILFGTTTGTTGSDNNTISFCHIRDWSVADGGNATLPRNGIYCYGTATAGKENSGNTVDNCRFYDICETSAATWASNSIDLYNGADAWTITNNHFYQTSSYTFAAVAAIDVAFGFIRIVTGAGYAVNGNFMGGTAPNAGGSAFIVTSGDRPVQAILFSGTGSAGTNTVNGNTIANMNITLSYTGTGTTLLCIGTLHNTNFIIGAPENGNIIGSTGATGGITLTHNGTTAIGIKAITTTGTGTNTISYNTIGGITLNGTMNDATTTMINVSNGTVTIDNNIIGSTLSNNILVSSNSKLYGIYNSSANGITITNNTIQNFKQDATTSIFAGIYNTAGILTTTGNTVKNINSASSANNYMIYHNSSTGATANISSNTIQDISLTGSSPATFYGIQCITAGAAAINSNIIGNTTNNNITNTSTGDCYAIINSGAGTMSATSNIIQEFNQPAADINNQFLGIYTNNGPLIANGNTIKNIDNANTGGDAMFGISFESSNPLNEATNNTIQNLNATSSVGFPRIYGIYTSVNGSKIRKNFISGFTNTCNSNIGGISGITFYTIGGWIAYNNVIQFSNAANSNDIYLIGIQTSNTAATPNELYHNTVKISGAIASGTSISACIYADGSTSEIIENNLFQNLRTGGTGGHYSEFDYSGINITDYNYLEVADDQNKIGNYGGTDYNFTGWKTASGAGNDLNGTTTLDASGHVLTGFIGANAGTNLSATVPDDRSGVLRDATPCMGAYENADPGPPLCGAYTIGGVSPDYATFTAAVADLQARGVSCPVIFNVRNGTYSEQIQINSLIGTSVTNTVTFQSENNDSSLVTLTYSANVTNNYTVKLNGTTYIIFKKITLQATDATYGRIVELTGGSSNNIIQNCRITGMPNSSYLIYGNGGGNNFNRIYNNCLIDGSSGIYFTSSTVRDKDNEIVENLFINQSSSAIYAQFQENLKIISNQISTNSTATISIIDIEDCDLATVISGNRINNSTSMGTAIFLSGCDGTLITPLLISNNFIKFGSTGQAYGFSLNTCTFINVYHNTIKTTSNDAVNGKCLATGGTCTNINVKNNIFSNFGGGYTAYVTVAAEIAGMDYNDLYTTGTNVGNWAGANQATLFNWRTASGKDANSVSIDPKFISSTDLHLTNRLLVLKIGTNLFASVPLDIDGQTRATNSWLGADEMDPAPAATTFQIAVGGALNDGSGAYSGQIIQTSDGGYAYFSNTLSSGAGSSDFYLVKTDANGIIQWSRTYGSTLDETGKSITQTTDGGYIMAGYTTGFGGAGAEDIYIVKTTPDGTLSWSKVIGGVVTDIANYVEETNDNGYMVYGYTASYGAGGNDFFILKTDGSGNIAWMKVYGSTGTEWGYRNVEAGNGDFIITGATPGGGGGDDVIIIRTNSSGTILWQKTYGGTGNDYGKGVKETADGGIIVSGQYAGASLDFYLLKTDASGNLLWSKEIGGSTSEDGYFVTPSNDGGYVVTGYSDNIIGSSNDASLLKVDGSGNLLWAYTYGGSGSDKGQFVTPSNDEGFAIGGWTNSFGAGGYDAYLIKTNSNGSSGCNEATYSPTVTIPTTTVNTSALTTATPTPTITGHTTTVGTPTSTRTELCSYPPTISTSAISPTTLYRCATMSVPYTITGSFNSGNIFTAQLSDATGSFAAPVNIGTLASTTAGTITATIPSGAAFGTAYRIRVISSNPVITGTDNGTNLAITNTFTVTSTSDAGAGTLRQAITDANNACGHDIINFNLGAGGPFTISFTTALPDLTDNDGVTIEGWDNSGNNGTPNTVPVFSATTATPMDPVYKIILGNSGSIPTGLVLASNYNVIQGLVLQDFGDGTPSSNDVAITISGNNNQILGCYIGMDATGTTRGTKTNIGISISGANNTIGDGTAVGANLISGMNTSGVGIYINGAGATGNTVKGNLIGLQKDGSTIVTGALQGYGVFITSSAASNTIGGSGVGEGNVISGNSGYGIATYSAVVAGNSVLGNIIGPQADGTSLVASNGQNYGILINNSLNNIIGGNITGARNIISANETDGVYITGASPTGNTVKGNYIGIDKNGTNFITGSAQDVGVWIQSNAASNTIGGSGAGEGNVISGNSTYGIYTSSSAAAGNTMLGNIIGPQADGITYLASNVQLTGVYISGSPNNTVGGNTVGARNIISSNETYGVYIRYAGSTGNVVKGNYIGPGSSQSNIVGSSQDYGVYIINSASNTTIGGNGAGEENQIAFNTANGVYLTSAAATGNLISRNPIYNNTSKPINLNYGASQANNGIAVPVISTVNATSVSGTSGANNIIEVFKNTSGNCSDASTYIGTATANGSGNWSLSGLSLVAGDYVLATATDGSNNTSEFSTCMSLSSPPTITSLGSTSGCVGSVITINGTDLTGATSVTIGGTAVAAILTNTAVQITATIGSGTTGTVSVTTPLGTAVSAATFTVNTIPSITATTPASRCGTGTVTLGATLSAGTITWWDTATGGTNLGTGSTFITPTISTTTTYYVDATDNGCTTASRTAVTATVFDQPYDICVYLNDSVSLDLPVFTGTIQWQESVDGSTWSDIPGATYQPYQFKAIVQKYYRAKIINGTCNPVYSPVKRVNIL